ncbi:MAG: hypothetical protein II740_02690, partial [Lachnospiraceae bacterium]|nr:hypothetical protein [Lachnospiraceae bacterium]
ISVIADMSKEALKKLEDEARIVDPAAIIRYIRVFGELTNQIRYASNKRVLVEVALVKLCCPQMEAKEDSIVPRIRSLEEKLEKGVMVSSPASVENAPVKETVKPAELPKSVPEDIKLVVSNWRKIIAELDSSHRSFIKNAKPSLGAEGELLLVFSNQICKEYFDTTNETTKAHAEENFKDLKDTIERIAGKQIEVKVELAKDEVHFESSYPNLLSMFDGVLIEEED